MKASTASACSAFTMPFSRDGAVVGQSLATVVRSCGENALAYERGTAGAVEAHDRRGGSTPPETGLACAFRPFGEVAYEIFPCRKAVRCWRVAEVSPEGFGPGMRRSSGAPSE